MLYNSAHIVEENNDMGFESKTDYLHINSVGLFEYNQKWSSRHRIAGRADYLMMYVYSGKMVVRLNDGDTVINEGAVVFYHPGQEQLYMHHMECSVKCFWVHFTGYGVGQLLKSLELDAGYLFNIGINIEVPSQTKIMINEILTKNIGYKTLTASIFIQILTNISRKALGYKRKDNKITHYRIYTTLNHIHMNYMRNITVSELSKMSLLCPNMYIKVFKKELGITPKSYIIRLRLEKARELFDSTSLNIKQVSGMVGIENQLYFSRLFKKEFKISPSVYRSIL